MSNYLDAQVHVDSNALCQQILKSLPTDLMISLPTGPAIHYLAPVVPGSVEFDAEGFSAYFRYCFGLQRSTQYSDASDRILLLAETAIEISALHESANLVFDSTVVDLDNSLVQDFLTRNTEVLARSCGSLLKDPTGTVKRCSTEGDSVLGFYEACVLYKMLRYSVEHALPQDIAETIYLACNEGPTCIILAASAALGDSLATNKKATYQRNKVASDLSGKMTVSRAGRDLIKLAALYPSDSSEAHLPRQRLILLVRSVLDFAKEHTDDTFLSFAAATLMLKLVTGIRSEYGSFWEVMIDWTHRILQKSVESDDLSLRYSALKLLSWFSVNFEANDDLSEFWINAKSAVDQAVANAFLAPNNTRSQSATLCSLVAARLMRTVPVTSITETQKQSLPQLLAYGEEHVQLTAISCLEQLIDAEREEMILSAALAKEYEEVSVGLPAELVSIVLDSAIESEEDVYDIPQILPTSHRGYCIAWILIFRYFTNTPLRMRVKLVQDLEELDLVEPLLGFLFTTLGLSDARPADLSKLAKVTLDNTYTSGKEELRAYAAHIFYLCLAHIPTSVRTWWIECRDRLLTTAVGTLTEKFYSLSLIQNDVQSLQSESCKKVLSDENLKVRVSNGGKDILTTYDIDDQRMEMAIHLPANYPLRKVHIEGVQRIGVKDAQWRAWLLASQAVLSAQNGSILDAISLFQRNVSLHFEGVADCAICFSILSVQDKSLPSKKCATCKNLFHGSCLFKWFKSSSQSRCPLCRNTFAF